MIVISTNRCGMSVRSLSNKFHAESSVPYVSESKGFRFWKTSRVLEISDQRVPSAKSQRKLCPIIAKSVKAVSAKNQQKMHPICGKIVKPVYNQWKINEHLIQSTTNQQILCLIIEQPAKIVSNQRTIGGNCIQSAKSQRTLCPVSKKSAKTVSNQRKNSSNFVYWVNIPQEMCFHLSLTRKIRRSCYEVVPKLLPYEVGPIKYSLCLTSLSTKGGGTKHRLCTKILIQVSTIHCSALRRRLRKVAQDPLNKTIDQEMSV